MKMIRINGETREFSTGVALFQDFLGGLNEELKQSNQVIASVKVDGKELSAEEETLLSEIAIDQVGEIEILTASPLDLAYETLNTLDQYVELLMGSVAQAADYYKKKNLISGDTYLAKAIDGLDLFVQTIGGVKLAIRVGLNPKIALIEATLVSIVQDLLETKRQSNYVFLAELLEKDLAENLSEWKTIAFPIFRNYRIS